MLSPVPGRRCSSLLSRTAWEEGSILLRFQPTSILVARELRAILSMAAALLGCGVLVVVVTLFRLPAKVALVNLLSTPAGLATTGIMLFVQSQILKEKASKTLLFLRTLPVSNDVIITGKIVAIIVAASIVYVLPSTALLIALSRWQVSLPPLALWSLLWGWICVLVIGLVWTALAVEFEQRRARIVALAILAVVFAIIEIIGHAISPMSLVTQRRLFMWGLIPAGLFIVCGWRWIVFRFRSRDFADLVE